MEEVVLRTLSAEATRWVLSTYLTTRHICAYSIYGCIASCICTALRAVQLITYLNVACTCFTVTSSVRTLGISHSLISFCTTLCTAALLPVSSTITRVFLHVPHARPALRLPAHAASNIHIDALVPTCEQEVPADHRCRTGCKSSSSVHHILSACNCAPPCAPSRPCPDRCGREPLPVQATRTPRAPGHESVSPGKLLCPPRPWLGPRGCICPAGAPCG